MSRNGKKGRRLRKGSAGKTSGGGKKLVPQPNGGALLAGGIVGHRGAGGRPPDAFRALARQLLEDRSLLGRLADMAEGKVRRATIRDQRGAIDTLLRVGVPMLREISTEEVRAKLGATVKILRDELPPETASAVLARLAAVWRP